MTELDRVQTLPELLAYRAALSPVGEAYREYDPVTQRWLSLNWAQVQERVAQWQRALAASGVRHSERVAILLPNGLAAMSIDQAVLAQGAVPVPLHAIDNPGSIAYILADCEACLLVVAQAEQWERIRAVGTPLPALRRVVVCNESITPVADTPAIQGLNDWLATADSAAAPSAPPGPEDLATIVYTSGTTGKPKGVMLTHRNVVANVRAVLARVLPLESDVFLSFLPLSHTFERTAGYYVPIAAGSCVVYARSVALLVEDLKNVRPTVLISVPRIYERVYAKLHEALAVTPWKLRLLEAAQDAGWRRFRAAQGLTPPSAEEGASAGFWRCLPWPLLRRLVALPLLAQFGGRVRVAVSGGAPLSPAIARCFLGLGLPLLQGYGMTETAPVVAANGLDDNDPATVGRALPGVEVRIASNRELQVRAPSVMQGYWNRAEDTARVINAEGWLATGDQAEIVDGRIRILGRIKEIIVTSTGEKVPPGDLELALLGDPLFEQVFVVGEQRPFIACVALLQREEWQRLAASLGLDPEASASLTDPRAVKAALKHIELATASFARYSVPRNVHLVRDPWTIENGFMTPTLKLKRNRLMEHYASAIEGLYQKQAGR